MATVRMLSCVLAAVVLAQGLRADDWPQWLGPQRDGVWREDGVLENFPAGGPKVRWRVKVGGGYSSPSVANGRVYITDRELPPGVKLPENPFQQNVPVDGHERVLCLNEADGKVLWTHSYPCTYSIQYAVGPRAQPLVHDGKVYTLGAEGHLFCLNAEDGKVIWSKDYKKEYGAKTPVWGFSSSPLIEGDAVIVYCTGVDNTVLALNKNTGEKMWSSLTTSNPGYNSPMTFEIAGQRQMVVWHADSVNGIDPASGKPYWSFKFPVRFALTAPAPRVVQNADGSTLLFITSFYNGPVLLRFEKGKPAEPQVVYRGNSTSEKNTDILHSIMPAPHIEDGHIYGVCSYGQFRCIELATGKRIWETTVPTGGPFPPEQRDRPRWANTYIVKNGNRFFLPNELGDLIIAKLSPKGYEEVGRAHLLEPTAPAMTRKVAWAHPAFANKSIYWRNDEELVCVSLAKE